MKTSLVFLQLEIADDSFIPNDLTYQSDLYFTYVDNGNVNDVENDLSFTLQAEQVEVPSNFKEIPALHQGSRKYREFTIETYLISKEQDMAEKRSHSDEPKIHRSVSESSDTTYKTSAPRTIQYFSGNPMVEVTKGILHLFKDKYLSPMDADVPRSEIICLLGVPAKYNCQDLQSFIAPAGDSLEHIKIIRDNVPNQYMVLLRFKDQKGADDFYLEYEGKPYNMLESDELFHLVYVSKIECLHSSQGGYLPMGGWTELPTCPVCLERMDESVQGILTVLCNHAFHNECLMKWKDSCCPVCRYCQTPEPSVDQKCSECDSKESLWICLICGHVGCGRYQEQHAYQHYQQTAHTYSMHLENQRVWDYAGDNYVHRLIQSKGDGKLVSLHNSEIVDGEKMDSLVLEYTYLLTNQLESQRRFFEEKIEFLEKDASEKLAIMEGDVRKMVANYNELEERFVSCDKERKNLERKYENVVGKVGQITKELRDERQLNSCLRKNQSEWQEQVNLLRQNKKLLEERKNSEIDDLKQQVGDLMRHIEVQMAVSNAESGIKQDIQGGKVFVEPNTSTNSPTKSRGKSHKK